MLAAIRNWVVRTMMKAKGETGIVQTMPKKEIVEINTQITAQRLMENGIDPRSLKNADQVENAIIAIESRPKVQQGIRSTKSADVFDLKGKKIKNTDNIIGGEELPPPGSRGGPDDIAAPIQSSEETMKNMIESELMKSENPFSDLVKTTKQKPKTIKEREAEILASMEKSNKETVQRIKNRKMVKDAIDNASPGFVKGDRKYNAQLVADDLAEKKFGKDFYDLDQRQQMDLYGEALDGLDDSDKFAQGGRIGLMAGSIPKIFKLLKDPKKVKQAIDNIFPTGDVKYDATMAAESLVELNPKIFGNKLYDDLDSITRLDIYDAVISPMMSAQAKAFKMKKITKPEKTLQSMKEGKGINMSDPEIAKEFEQFMKQTDPEGVKKLEQTLELDNFDPKGRKKNATGGRAGFANGSGGLLDILNIQASGSKSGKQQINKAPEGITIDSETYNVILNADIPINEKINLLTTYGRDKGRDKIEKDGQELFLGEGGSRIREIGLDINPDAERGFGGNIMYNPDSDGVKGGIKYKFADGGRTGFSKGSAFKTIFNFLNENNPVQAYQKYLKSVKTRAQENPKALAPELAAIASGGIFVNRRMQDILKNMKEKDMENNLENFKEELNKDPFYQKYPDIKDKVLENYTEKMFGEKRADGGRIGYFMGSANPKGLGLLRQILNYMSKKGKETGGFKGADLSGLDMLRLSNPKAFNKLLEDVRGKVNIREGIMGTDTVRAQQQALRGQRKDLTEKSLDVAKAMKEDQDKIKIRLAKETETTIIPKVKKQLMEGMGMSEEAAEKAARDMAEAAQNIKLMDSPPEITDEGLLQLENVLKNLETGGKKKRDLNADGGRIGFKDGMTRRTFLKIFSGLVSLPIIGKVVKPLKLATGVKKVPIIKTGDVPGKPEWFDALVNKVIIEGDDVTKRFATQERQVVHMKKIDDETSVTVTQDLNDGSIMVDIDDPIRNVMGESGDDTSVMMMLKKNPGDESNPASPDEFSFTEADMRNYMDGPDDYTTEFTENTVQKMKDLTSDLGKIKSYATGKKPTLKQIVESKKRQDKVKFAEENPAEYAAERGPDIDYSDYEYASGGIARMLGE